MTSGPSERRKLRNFLQIPRIQVRWGIYAFFLGAFSTLANQMLLMRQLRGIVASLLMTGDVDPVVMSAIVSGPIQIMISRMLIFLAAFSLLCLAVGIFVSHRVVGPLVPIRRQLETMIEGEYGRTYDLRAKDELKDIMELLNDLSTTLARRHGSEQSAETPAADSQGLAA